MAIYNAGYLSPIRKKLGNAVGRKWRTLDVLAVYQPFVSNPNTEAQRTVRKHFSILAKLAMVFANPAELGFANICKGTKVPQRSMFIRKNYDTVTMVDDQSGTVDYTMVSVAQGNLPECQFGSPAFTDPLEVEVAMTSTTGVPGTDEDDVVYLVVYSPEAGAAIMTDGRNKRSDASMTANVPAYWNGHRVHVWGFAIGGGTDNKGVISNSRYIGSGTIS